MFNRNISVEYAREWAYKRNPRYYDFDKLGGDCTNFVSQCLHAGGIEMNYSSLGWYYTNLNSRAPAWTGVNEFWNFGINNTGKGVRFDQCAINDLEIADFIQLYNGTRFYHNLLVTKVEKVLGSKVIYVSAHDFNAFNRPLSNYMFSSYRCGKILN